MPGRVVPARAPPLAHAETRKMGIAAVQQGGDEALQDDLILPILSPFPKAQPRQK